MSKKNTIYISGIEIPSLTVYSDFDCSHIIIQHCIVQEIVIDRSGSPNFFGPRFVGCDFALVLGAASEADLPKTIFLEANTFEKFSNELETNSEIRQQNLPVSLRVLLICLKKLFVQPGNGRQESAFSRGVDGAEGVYVDTMLSLIASHDFARPVKAGGSRLWVPNRVKQGEALAILRAPQQTSHPLVQAARSL